MKKDRFWNFDIFKMILIGGIVLYLGIHHAKAAAEKEPIKNQNVARRDVRTVKLSNLSIATLRVMLGRSTILSFPTKPNKVILGNQGMFAIEYVERDLAIAPLQVGAQGNLFVYLEGRRFAFDLITVTANSDSIVMVRDEEDQGLSVNTQ